MKSATIAEPDPSGIMIFVGRDAAGHWLVQGCHRQLEGRFISREAASAFARDEQRGQPGARLIAALHTLTPTVSFDPPRPDETALGKAA